MINVRMGNHDTWNEWHLLLVSHNTGIRDVYTHYTDLESTDGRLDDTEALTGSPVYGLKTSVYTFRAIPKLTGENYMDTYYKLIQNIHGKKIDVNLDGATHNGRCSISEMSVKDSVADITIEVEG